MSTTTTVASIPTAATQAEDDTNCGNGGGSDSLFGVRVASVFIIMFTSMFGALFPVVSRRTRLNNIIPRNLFEFAKYFGSGVIIATAFIHLLGPAISELITSPCLANSFTWQVYPWPLALCMLSIFCIFFLELFAFRIGSAKLAKLGIQHDPHGHTFGGGHNEGTVEAGTRDKKLEDSSSNSDIESAPQGSVLDDSAVAQIIGIFILEFGILLHSVLIGLTLAVDPGFKVLFVVIIFHQMFEGLGLGSRLAFLKLPPKYNHVAVIGAILYGITTPIGIAAGLGVRSTYNPGSTTATIVSGVMDSLSAGILIYTGMVELLAHEFLFNKEMNSASLSKLGFSCLCMLFGAGIMALLGRWA